MEEAVNNKDNVDNGEWNKPSPSDAAHWFVTYLFLDHDAIVVSNKKLNRMQKDWFGLEHYTLLTNKMPALIHSLQSSVTIALRVTRLSRPATVVIYLQAIAPDISDEDLMVAKTLSASIIASNRTIAIPVCKRESSSTIKKCRQLIATESATIVLEKKYILDITEVKRSSHLSPVSMFAQEALLQAIKTVYFVYDKEFWSLLEKHELRGGSEPGESDVPILCNCRCNVHTQKNFQ